jgi:glutathione S-transferase
MIRIYGARWVPPFVQGLVRDLRVRWALEEAGLVYEAEALDRDQWTSEKYRQMQPFGQLPAYQEDGLTLFESGAIVLHVARRSQSLLPADEGPQARVIAWMFAALNSIEPAIQNLTMMDLFNRDDEWARLRRPSALEAAERRLDDLAAWLQGREHLEGGFSAADILMTTVLRVPRHTDLVASRPALDAYQRRCEARPAFQKALADQMEGYRANEPVPA